MIVRQSEARPASRAAAPFRDAGRIGRAGIVMAVAGMGALVLAATPATSTFLDAPPTRSSGGFGEESCIGCHFGEELNDPEGTFLIEGIPPRYAPGETYPLTVTLLRPGMRVAGFQLTARFAADGFQAGELVPDPREADRVGVLTDRGVQYAQHLLGGTSLYDEDGARWSVLWRAPARGPGPGVGGPSPGDVVFHAAGNAGDGDDSQIGDFVYTLEEVTSPQP